MTETATTVRRWALPFGLLVTLLASLNEWPSPSFQSGANGKQLWKCSACGWVQSMAERSDPPVCQGSKTDKHARTYTELIEDGSAKPSTGKSRFR
jgi:hypothetical protein